MVGLLPFLVLFASRDDIERRAVGSDLVRRTLLRVHKQSRVDTGRAWWLPMSEGCN
jgi:hypothetical protein